MTGHDNEAGPQGPSVLGPPEDIAVVRAEVSDLEEVEEVARRTALRWSIVMSVVATAYVVYAAVAIGPQMGIGTGLLYAVVVGVPCCAVLWYRYVLARDLTGLRRGELEVLAEETLRGPSS